MKRWAVVVLALLLACGREPSGNAKVTAELRMRVLSAKLPIEARGDEVVVVIVDMAMWVVGTTTVATKDGDASLYTSKGGAVIGAGSYPKIREAALRLVGEAERHKASMKPATSFPFPRNGKVRFYVRTPQQVYMAEAEVTELTGDKHPLAPLFGAAMDLSTLLQNVPEGP